MPKPNIVFIHVDQMHHKAMSAYGCRWARTPNMDRMAREGYSFMESYTPMPQCCPVRASWYTGRMSKEHGVVVNGYPLDPSIPDLGQWLRKAGYDSVYTGKWHVSGRNVGKSFQVLHRGSGHGELGDSAVARSAVAFLENRKGDKPFFLNVGFLNPHDCCFPATANGGPGKNAFAPAIEDKLPELPGNFDYGYNKRGGKNRTGRWSLLDWRYYRYQYYRMVEMVDHEVGRVYNAVRNSPHRDNTLIVFASDHGDGAGFHAKVSKGYLEEEASRVPAIVCWPGKVPEGVRDSDHLVSGVDIAATICDYAEAPPLPKMTVARSWRPLLEGRKVPWREYVVSETSVGGLSTLIREKRFKTIFYENRVKLYDIEKDPLETRDLAQDPKYADTIERHRAHFRDYISKIEVYPGQPRKQEPKKPAAGRRRSPRGVGANGVRTTLQMSYYDNYVKWYGKVLAEGKNKDER